jgi:hypothetical protein
MTALCRRILLAALLFCAIAAGGCVRRSVQTPIAPPSLVPPEPEVRQVYLPSFSHSGSGLTFDAPEGWGFVQKPGYALAECRPRQAESDLPVILVQASPASEDLSMEAIVSGYSKQIAKGIENPKIILDHAVKTGFEGAQAYQIACTGQLAGTSVTSSPVLIRRGGWLVVATLICPQTDYAALKPLFAQTVRIQEPDAKP